MADGDGSGAPGRMSDIFAVRVGAKGQSGQHFNRHLVAPHACATCGIETTRPMYCSKRCGVRGHRKRNPGKLAAYRAAEFQRKRIALAWRATVRAEIADLRWIAGAVRRAQRLAANRGKCRHCGDEFRRVRKYMQFCSAPCGEEAKRTAKRRARIKRRKTPSHRKHKSAYKAKRRSLEVSVKPFDPIEVLERDGWRCYLCGVDTPRSLRGQMAPNAPEIDHVIPLAAGGEHSMANTRCACRHCNGKKGASLIEIAA